MAKQTKPAPRKFQPTSTNLLKINRLGLHKCFTMDKDLARVFTQPLKPVTTLRGGVAPKILSPEEVAWARERERARRSREATQVLIAKLRQERLEQLAIERNEQAVDMIRRKAL